MKTILAARRAPHLAPARLCGRLHQPGRARAGGVPRWSSEDLGAAFAYKGVTPAKRAGPAGLRRRHRGHPDAARELARSSRKAGAGDRSTSSRPEAARERGTLRAASTSARSSAARSDLDATVFGMDVRYALVEDTLTTPAVAVRVCRARAPTGMGPQGRHDRGARPHGLEDIHRCSRPTQARACARDASDGGGTARSPRRRFNKGRVFRAA